MSLFNSLTGPKWQHKNPDIRREAIAELDDEAILVELVNTDPDSAVRMAALSRITAPDTLDGLIDSLAQPLQAQAREQRLRQLLPANDQLAEIDDTDQLVHIASLAGDQGLVTAAIGRITDETRLVNLACDHAQARVRITAAQRITDLDAINGVMQRTRGRDKSVYRHCKALLDAHQAQQQQEADRQMRIEQMLQRAAGLGQFDDLAGLDSACRLITHQLGKLQEWLSEDQRKALDRLLAEGTARRTALAEDRAATLQVQADTEQSEEAFAALLAELESLATERVAPVTPDMIDTAQKHLASLEERWEAMRQTSEPSTALESRYEGLVLAENELLRSVKRLLGSVPKMEKLLRQSADIDGADYDAVHGQHEKVRQFLDQLTLPGKSSGTALELVGRLQQSSDALAERLKALQKDQDNLSGRTRDALQALEQALEENHVKMADRALARARKHLASLAPQQRNQFEHEINPLAARLREMHDWQGFAIEPKKVELCGRMESLVGNDLDPDSLAARIKELQEEWRLLGALPHAREQALWLQFKAAADKAWEPCQAAFDKRAELHRQNYAKRMQIVAQLKEYEQKMAWPDVGPRPDAGSEAEEAGSRPESQPESQPGSDSAPGSAAHTAAAVPDWRMVQKTLDTARTAFREINPVTPKADRKSHKAFQAICDHIYAHIKAEYSRNIQAKEDLVHRAEQLAGQEDLPRAIEQAKQLQSDWKNVGITPMAADRKLWKTFRSACDAIFTRLDQQRGQLQAETNAQIKAAEELVEQARTLVGADEQQTAQAGKALTGIRQQVERMGLPRAVQQRLAGELQKLQREAAQSADALRARQKNASWAQLESVIQAAAVVSARRPEDETWSTDKSFPRGVDIQQLEMFWREGPATGHDEALREACIGLEVLAGIDSPPADKQARMNYQMQRLVKGLGVPDIEPRAALIERLNAFIELRPSAQWAERFCATVRVMNDRT